ncbi:glycosyltransferase family 4 protein [Lichenicola sp.]|uniref:glycosyltransferase family 4 protein n=1 Tax=Lichenicola sp. TaxID=2804529 RepID=UPI003B00102A
MEQASAIWIDVEDLFHYVGHNARLSGIQRLTYELYTVLEQQAAGGRPVGFVRIDARTDAFTVVAWEQVRGLCHALTVSHPVPEAQPAGSMVRVRRRSRGIAVALQRRLPAAAGVRFGHFCAQQTAALRALMELRRASRTGRPAGRDDVATAASGYAPTATAGSGHASAELPVGRPLRDVARPGDWLLSLGAAWHRVDYGQLLQRARTDLGVRTGLLFYDLIPLRRPEWCHQKLVQSFGRWFDGVMPHADAIFAISEATAQDVGSYLEQRGKTPVRPIRTIPVGTGFPASTAALGGEAARIPARRLPAPGSYVLFVSTIEARKNHALMFQVWRRMAQELPPHEVPTLVFAGRIGWLVADLMLQIANTNYVDGKLQIIEDPSDAVLIRLYQGCLFTVLPSLFEGWGLPVTESLAAGKPCVISNLTALPEAGAGLARLIDPFDFNDAYRVILDTVRDRDGLARWEQEVRSRFRPVSWERSARALLDGLDAHEAAMRDHPVAVDREVAP